MYRGISATAPLATFGPVLESSNIFDVRRAHAIFGHPFARNPVMAWAKMLPPKWFQHLETVVGSATGAGRRCATLSTASVLGLPTPARWPISCCLRELGLVPRSRPSRRTP